MVSHVQAPGKNGEKNSSIEGRRELGGLEKIDIKTFHLLTWDTLSLSFYQARRGNFLLPVGFCHLHRA